MSGHRPFGHSLAALAIVSTVIIVLQSCRLTCNFYLSFSNLSLLVYSLYWSLVFSRKVPRKVIHFKDCPELFGSNWISAQPVRGTWWLLILSIPLTSANINLPTSASPWSWDALIWASCPFMRYFSLHVFQLLTGASWNKSLLWVSVYLYASEFIF